MAGPGSWLPRARATTCTRLAPASSQSAGRVRGMCDDARVDDAVDLYQRACRANNIAQMVETLAPDVELVSPLSGRMVFSGKDDVGVLLEAVYSSVSDFRWSAALGDGK